MSDQTPFGYGILLRGDRMLGPLEQVADDLGLPLQRPIIQFSRRPQHKGDRNADGHQRGQDHRHQHLERKPPVRLTHANPRLQAQH